MKKIMLTALVIGVASMGLVLNGGTQSAFNNDKGISTAEVKPGG